jgi:hypothetical protein
MPLQTPICSRHSVEDSALQLAFARLIFHPQRPAKPTASNLPERAEKPSWRGDE